jgi:polyisoprenoid-binding protein YceI
MSIVEQTRTIPTGTYTADTVHSNVAFEVEYAGVGTFAGTITKFQAELADGALAGSAEVASVVTKDANLQAHLLSPDFFDAERYPQVSFATTSARAEGSNVEFEGEITIKGTTRPVTLTGTVTGPVADAYGNERYILVLETTIDRTQFGINWNAPMPDGTGALSNEVTLKADLSLVKA